LSLILVTLGTGLDLSTTPGGFREADFTVSRGAILWLIIIQLIASATGGYLAGRLRTKWATIHTDEVYFRDTAHGFLVWAVGLVITGAFLASSASSIGTNALSARTDAGSAYTSMADLNLEPNGYFIDALFRSEHPASGGDVMLARAEAARIIAHALRQRALNAADESYLARLVVTQTGLSQDMANSRVSAIFAEVQAVANANRKALAHLSLWTFIALLIGAFSASYAATLGGRESDHVVIVRSSHGPSNTSV
jgi:hypothetical protein